MDTRQILNEHCTHSTIHSAWLTLFAFPLELEELPCWDSSSDTVLLLLGLASADIVVSLGCSTSDWQSMYISTSLRVLQTCCLQEQ